MFEKDLRVAYLLDFYGDLLSDRKRKAVELYYNDDLSLAETAIELDISRQGARDIIVKAAAELEFFEEKLHLAKRFSQMRTVADILEAKIAEAKLEPELKNALDSLVELVRS